MKVTIRRVSLGSLGKMGCLLGSVAAFLPSLLCGLAATGLAVLLRRWLEGWQEVPISVLGREIASFDFVQLLHLEQVLNTLQTLTAVSAATLVLIVLGLALISGLLLAVIIMLVGLAYNGLAGLTGGLVVEMSPAVKKRESVPVDHPPSE